MFIIVQPAAKLEPVLPAWLAITHRLRVALVLVVVIFVQSARALPRVKHAYRILHFMEELWDSTWTQPPIHVVCATVV